MYHQWCDITGAVIFYCNGQVSRVFGELGCCFSIIGIYLIHVLSRPFPFLIVWIWILVRYICYWENSSEDNCLALSENPHYLFLWNKQTDNYAILIIVKTALHRLLLRFQTVTAKINVQLNKSASRNVGQQPLGRHYSRCELQRKFNLRTASLLFCVNKSFVSI